MNLVDLSAWRAVFLMSFMNSSEEQHRHVVPARSTWPPTNTSNPFYLFPLPGESNLEYPVLKQIAAMAPSPEI